MSSAEEESYHQGTASMSTSAALEDDAFTPAPPERPKTVTEPARTTPVHAETQVLVAGGLRERGHLADVMLGAQLIGQRLQHECRVRLRVVEQPEPQTAQLADARGATGVVHAPLKSRGPCSRRC